uniref:dual oxidase 1 isoform X1 n=2 Tax=Ciona intestinalis TaxID=7719 RepID=UPI00089DBAE7|nr:dual oxidase 1 isoform X1 [Ciona intestinalis]|eukprot:XP_018673155.1 dual oxidase 1 isoform X1 [Ciona intestinalis]
MLRIIISFVIVINWGLCTQGQQEIGKEFPPFNGWYNNRGNPSLGIPDSSLTRSLPPHYKDGVYEPSGWERPNVRSISNLIFSGPQGLPSTNNKTALFLFFGEHVMQDILDTSRPGCPPEYFNIMLNASDSHFSTTEMPYERSSYQASNTGYSPNHPREQINAVTSYLDGSQIYGHTKAWSNNLRLLRSTCNGRTSTSSLFSSQGRATDCRGELASLDDQGEFPALNNVGLPLDNSWTTKDHVIQSAKRFYRVGSRRGNENPFVLTIGITWFRHHNWLARNIRDSNPNWSDDDVFNEARIQNIAMYQKVLMYEWLPGLLGTCSSLNQSQCLNVTPYTAYSSGTSASVSDIFEGAARHFLSTITPPGVFVRSKFNESSGSCEFRTTSATSPALSLCNSYWEPAETFKVASIDELTMGMASQIAELEDNVITPSLRHNYYGSRRFSRRDLMATILQKGRDHGLPDYNVAREEFGMQTKATMMDINQNLFQSNLQSNGTLLDDLTSLHDGKLSKLDIFTGGLLETTGGSPGELFRYVIADQFLRLRNGDRFWFENVKTSLLSSTKLNEILNTTFRDVILRTNPTINGSFDIQDNPFVWATGDSKLFCPQPYQLTENVLEECTPLQRYDYFTSSEVSFPLSFAFFGVFVLITLLVMYLVGRQRMKSALKTKKDITTKKRATIETSIASGNVTICTEILGENVRQIQIILRPENLILIKAVIGNQNLRKIELIQQQDIKIYCSDGTDRRTLIVRLQEDTYDLVLSFNDSYELDEFFNELHNFVKPLGLKCITFAIPEKHIMEEARTKEMRDKQLQNFFRTALSQAMNIESEDLDRPKRKTLKDLMKVNITKSEFAEYLKLKEDSLFVEQMFLVADSDEDGTISFREFLDIIVLFTKGTPKEKAQLMFNMYDLDKSGGLSKEEFTTMLKSMMEMVNSSADVDNIDSVVDDMMRANGFSSKDSLDLNDFLMLLGQYSDISNQQSTSNGHKTYQAKRQSKYHRYSKRFKEGPQTPQRRLTRKVKTVREDYKTKSYEKFFVALVKLTEHYANHIFCLSLYSLITAGVFLNAFFVVYSKNATGLYGIGGPLMALARASAAALMFNFSTLLLTMCRNIITFLRETFLHRFIPFDSAVTMHRIVAWMALAFTALHILAHGINFYSIVTQSPDDMACLFRDMWYPSDYIPTFVFWLFQTITGITGVILTLALIVMYVFASNYARRMIFNWFRWTHKLGYLSLYFFSFVHGSGMLISSPQFYYYFLVPGILFTLDKVYTYSRKKAYISVVRAELFPSDVTHLEFKRPKNFDYKAGQWVRIACLAQSSSEYHPFTLSSAPHEDTLKLHIRAVGPWTRNLRNIYDPNVLRDSPYPKLFLDGPFGEGHQDWYKYEVSVLVGGGIGVTPFASILKDLVNRSQSGVAITCKAVYFIWVTRDQNQYEWLTDIIQEVEGKDKKQILNTHIFITQFPQKFDLRTKMLYICEENFQKIAGKSLFTGLRAITHFGRPDFPDFFVTLGEEHSSVETFGVFSCGPPPMTEGVEKACAKLNKYEGPTFSHHFENF